MGCPIRPGDLLHASLLSSTSWRLTCIVRTQKPYFKLRSISRSTYRLQTWHLACEKSLHGGVVSCHERFASTLTPVKAAENSDDEIPRFERPDALYL